MLKFIAQFKCLRLINSDINFAVDKNNRKFDSNK